ncbi:MAG: exodeoxyribonuclease VII large subunit [Actinomycetales bacterium]
MTQRPSHPSPVPATAADTSPDNPWPIRLLTSKIGRYIMRMPVAWVEGQVVEISRRGDSAIAFLTLRDPDVDLSVSVTTGRRVLDSMATPLVEGARVVARVAPEYWEKRGRFSLTAIELRPVGVGALLAQIEHVRQLLASEGLFDDRFKKPLPFAPAVVGLICGRDSAAEHDVVVNAGKRWPAVRFEIARVAVQGNGAAQAVCQAIERFDADPAVEVIVLARGGGSLEDLLPFSNETLIRVAHACRTPLVSAIGHESDTPLLDLVADVRASTPTDAAKRIVPDVDHELAGVDNARRRLHASVRVRLDTEQQRLDALRSRPGLAAPLQILDQHADTVVQLRERGRRALATRLDRSQEEGRHLLARVRALSPKATLDRGYAVVLDAGANVVRDAEKVAVDDDVQVLLAHGRLAARVRDRDLE